MCGLGLMRMGHIHPLFHPVIYPQDRVLAIFVHYAMFECGATWLREASIAFGHIDELRGVKRW